MRWKGKILICAVISAAVRIGYIGGEGGIRTHGTAFLRHNRLAGDPDQPLQHLSAPSVVPPILALFQLDSNEKKISP